MKKLITMLLVLCLVVALAVPVNAVTPHLEIPDMPEISDIEFDINIEIPDEMFNRWFEEHPIDIIRPTEPSAPHEQLGEEVTEEFHDQQGWMDWLCEWFWWMH